ncbi:MAG: class I SAM-dependent methyltransferase [Gammaproteobacteria bacterium]
MPACPVCLDTPCAHFVRVDGCDYWRCRNCQATFLDPGQLPCPRVEQEQYRLHRNAVDDAGYRAFLGRLAVPLLARLAPGSSGLDYGCGPGPALAAMLAEAGHRMAIYDPLFFDDRTALEAAYDFITCTEVAEHFHRPAEEFDRLDGLLKPGGILALMTTFQTDDAAFPAWHYRRDPTHVVFYRPDTFRAVALHHGWRCEIPRANLAFLHKRP